MKQMTESYSCRDNECNEKALLICGIKLDV